MDENDLYWHSTGQGTQPRDPVVQEWPDAAAQPLVELGLPWSKTRTG